MATVRFSDTLKNDIRGAARRVHERLIDEATAAYDENWHKTVVREMYRDFKEKFAAVPDGFLKTTETIDIEGVVFAGDDEDISLNMLPCVEVGYELIVPQGREVDATTLQAMGLTYIYCGYGGLDVKLDGDDPRWRDIVPQMQVYTDNIAALRQQQCEFLEGVDKIINTFSTLAPALKEWPPLWDLLSEDVRDRHRKKTSRSAADKPRVEGVDLNGLTAAVTMSKLTR